MTSTPRPPSGDDPDDAKLDRLLDELVVAPLRRHEVDTEAALRRVRARLDEPATPAAARPALRLVRGGRGYAGVAPARSPRRWILGAIVAAAAVALVATNLTSPPAAEPPRGSAGSVVTTAVGVLDSVELADGTAVLLGPGSSMAVDPAFGDSIRSVRLTGVASFRVAHEADRPFVVRAGDALIRQVGTAFVVRADSGAGGTRVTVSVTEGVVAVRREAGGDSGAVLAAGDRASMDGEGKLAIERGVRTADDAAWLRGRLVYTDAPLEVIASDLRRWHGVELRVTDASLASMRVTATFDREPPDRVLEVLAMALGAEVERRGPIAILRRSGGSR